AKENLFLREQQKSIQKQIDWNEKKLEGLHRNEAPQPELPEGVKKAEFLVPLALALFGISAQKKTGK
ncbi:hypothetical protein, partial [Escherichia coli]|uniref:hypothetical protein n=1 Tax=Escherichia coli TaxID=562 RepID=UPI00215A74C5